LEKNSLKILHIGRNYVFQVKIWQNFAKEKTIRPGSFRGQKLTIGMGSTV
jgi:hypothetical protein